MHARRQQAAPGLTQHFRGATVDDDAALHGKAGEHPALAAFHARDGGGKQCSDRLSGGEPDEHISLRAGGYDSIGPAAGREARGLELRGHAADAGALEDATRQRFDARVDAVDARDQLGHWIAARVGGV